MDLQSPETLVAPTDMNARIWRYMKVQFLEDLLKKEALYFRRGDRFDDPYEGMLPDSYIEAIRRGQIRGMDDDETQIRYHLHHRCHGYASCWHLSGFESAAMWKLYANRGVAIRSTFSRLQHAFDACNASRTGLDQIDVGLVQYDERFLSGALNVRRVFLHKRPDFAHEREVRAFFQDTTKRDRSGWFVDRSTPISALIRPRKWAPPIDQWIPIDVGQLVTEIVVNPKASPSIVTRVKDAVRNSGLAIPVRQSTLFQVTYLDSFRR